MERPYTEATQRFPPAYTEDYAIYSAVERRPAPAINLSWQSIALVIGALALWYALGKSGSIGPQPDPAWAAPANISQSYNDNSVNVCIGWQPNGCR